MIKIHLFSDNIDSAISIQFNSTLRVLHSEARPELVLSSVSTNWTIDEKREREKKKWTIRIKINILVKFSRRELLDVIFTDARVIYNINLNKLLWTKSMGAADETASK